MSGVVLRCSNCGTAQTTTGECETCHEAQVGYFCTNHTPGVWLDSPACPRCGARFGQAAAAPKRSAPEQPPFVRVSEDDAGPWDATSPRSRSDVPDAVRGPSAGVLLDMLARAAHARSMRAGRADRAEEPDRSPGGGCVRRLLLLALLLAAFFLLVPLLLGGALLRLL